MQDVVGYEGLYAVDPTGQIWAYPRTWVTGNGTLRSHGGQFMKASVTKRGYETVMLRKDGRYKNFRVHQLVAKAFVPPFHGETVHHKDYDTRNNCATNLSWETRRYNTANRRNVRIECKCQCGLTVHHFPITREGSTSTN